MKNWKDVPIPKQMLENCEKDPRGIPVPFIILKDEDGKHHFKVNDSRKTLYCVIKNLCPICGQDLKKEERWLIGGIASAFDPNGCYIDLPLHKECGIYALKVCPYLAIKSYDGKTDLMKIKSKIKGDVALNNPTVDPDRLPFFVFGRPSAIQYGINEKAQDVRLAPIRPFLETEFWDEGEQITDLKILTERIVNTKWEKYLKDIVALPQFFMKSD